MEIKIEAITNQILKLEQDKLKMVNDLDKLKDGEEYTRAKEIKERILALRKDREVLDTKFDKSRRRLNTFCRQLKLRSRRRRKRIMNESEGRKRSSVISSTRKTSRKLAKKVIKEEKINPRTKLPRIRIKQQRTHDLLSRKKEIAGLHLPIPSLMKSPIADSSFVIVRISSQNPQPKR